MKIFNIPDITTDGSFTLGGACTGILLTNHFSSYLALPIVIILGASSGALTGLIHTKLRINTLLAGILVMTALYSINLKIMGRSNLPLINVMSIFNSFTLIADPNKNTLWVLILVVIILVAIVGYLLKTDFGLAMRATGNSESMIRALGVNTDRMKIIGLAIANALTATSGYLITQFQGYSDISMGIGVVILGLGSVIIAETFINWLLITSVFTSLLFVVSGAIVFQFVLAFTLNIGIDATFQKLIMAVFVLIIVILPRLSFKSQA